MSRRHCVVACVIVAMATAVAPTDAAAPTGPAATPVAPQLSAKQARMKATGCKRLFTRAQHRSYVTRVYRRSAPVTKRRHQKSYMLTRCQHSERSERIARAKWHKEMRDRKRILARGNAGLGFLMARERGWAGQFGCLNELWGNRESGWSTTAGSPGAAYGIPQAKPGYKMRAAGPGWQYDARTQIRWGLDIYIPQRYGTPCGALAHSNATGWY
jgi:hypothetical protein